MTSETIDPQRAGRTIIDDRGAVVDYRETFLDEAERRALMAELDEARALFDHDRHRKFGRPTLSRRLVCAFGEPGLRYRYAGVDREARPWLPLLRAARDRVAAVAGQDFNYGLVNLYRDGRDCITWHSDAERDIELGSTIASLSLGAARPFQLRCKATGAQHELLLADGSLLLMRGATQRLFKHQLPERVRIAGARFNITFRLARAR